VLGSEGVRPLSVRRCWHIYIPESLHSRLHTSLGISPSCSTDAATWGQGRLIRADVLTSMFAVHAGSKPGRAARSRERGLKSPGAVDELRSLFKTRSECITAISSAVPLAFRNGTRQYAPLLLVVCSSLARHPTKERHFCSWWSSKRLTHARSEWLIVKHAG
jgi:hypothetical protein